MHQQRGDTLGHGVKAHRGVVGGEGLNVTLAWRLPRTLADQAPATVHLDNLAGNKRRFAGQKSHCARDIQGLAQPF